MRTIHVWAILAGITTFGALAGLMHMATVPDMFTIIIALLVGLNAGWTVVCPKTVVQFYADTAQLFFGRSRDGDWAVGLTVVLYGATCLASIGAFALGNYWAMEHFWGPMVWHQEALAFFDAKMGTYYYTSIELFITLPLTAAMLFVFATGEAFQQTFVDTSHQRVLGILKIAAVTTALIFLNHIIWVVLMGVTALAIAGVFVVIALYMLVATIRLAGEQHMVSVTVGILVGNVAGWVIVGFAIDIQTLLAVIAVGTVTGLVAGEITHRCGQLFIRREWVFKF